MMVDQTEDNKYMNMNYLIFLLTNRRLSGWSFENYPYFSHSTQISIWHNILPSNIPSYYPCIIKIHYFLNTIFLYGRKRPHKYCISSKNPIFEPRIKSSPWVSLFIVHLLFILMHFGNSNKRPGRRIIPVAMKGDTI
jgi:hypothetical protein